ncbi:transposase [Patescibacteria group bacterium]|nr:transposase [Patescibacteria group bacterium]
MRNLFPFHLGNVIRKLNQIRIAINLQYRQPFPKPKPRLLSYYSFVPRRIKIKPSGEIAGGLARFVTSLIDFSFVRSITASAYSPVGGHAYDPVSLFLLELFRYLEKFPDLKTFLSVVRDEEKGKHYRLYAGISFSHVPCEADFTHLKDRLGETLYTQIAQVLVEIVRLLGLLSFSILSTDGTLFPSYSHYKGCTYFCEECHSIEFKGLIENVRRRILYKLKEPKRVTLGRDIKVRIDCPSTRFPEDIPKPKVELLTLSLKIADPEQRNPFSKIFGVEEELQSQGLDVAIKRINFHSISLDQIDSFFFRCPKLPSDTEARIGVRRNPKNPDKLEKIFGYNAILNTSIELSLGLELPTGCLTISGNAEEGNQFIPLKEQLSRHHPNTKIDLADAKYDELHNYEYARTLGSIALIDYNVRNEDVSLEGLKLRGYDKNGWPFAPCRVLCRPNGFDFSFQRATFTCQRQCAFSGEPQLKEYSQSCPYFMNYHGFIKHMSTKQYPRLITEIIRGTPRYQKLRSLRSASERINSTAKEDLKILLKPKVRGLKRAAILGQLTLMTILLKRVAQFIIPARSCLAMAGGKVTLAVRKERTKNPHGFIVIRGPKVPKFILNLVQRE